MEGCPTSPNRGVASHNGEGDFKNAIGGVAIVRLTREFPSNFEELYLLSRERVDTEYKFLNRLSADKVFLHDALDHFCRTNRRGGGSFQQRTLL